MTKTLSEQLCEFVGLEYENKMLLGDGEVECTYLDFEQPENFVKLFNLQVEQVEDNQTKPTVSGFISDYHWFNDTNGFLEMLISELKENDEYNTIENQWRDSIKQAIRDYNGWVWG